ncbi:hypothetical protein Tco_0400473 [Tanacetum coccineum]
MSRVHPIDDSLSSKVKSMRAHIASKPSIQVNKIASSCEICSGPYDTQYCMENPEQAFVDYASLHNNRVGGMGIDMHAFVGNMSYVMDFTILKNVEANIDPNSSQVVFGRPFMETTKLILDGEKALIKFIDGTRKVAYETPYKDPKMDDLTSEGHYLLSSKIILSDDDISITHDCNKRDVLESDCTNELGNKVDEPIVLSDHMFRTSGIQVMPRYPKFKFCSRTLVADGATTGITVVLINFPVGTTWAGVILVRGTDFLPSSMFLLWVTI